MRVCGEQEVRGHAWVETRSRSSRAGIRATTSWLVVSRMEQRILRQTAAASWLLCRTSGRARSGRAARCA